MITRIPPRIPLAVAAVVESAGRASVHWYRFFSDLVALVTDIRAEMNAEPKTRRATASATLTVDAADRDLVFSAACTVTLPSPAASVGRELYLKVTAAAAVISASSNVVPLAGGAAGTAILPATAGKWARLVSDGTNWEISAAN